MLPYIQVCVKVITIDFDRINAINTRYFFGIQVSYILHAYCEAKLPDLRSKTVALVLCQGKGCAENSNPWVWEE